MKGNSACTSTWITDFVFDQEKVVGAQIGWDWCTSTKGVKCNDRAFDYKFKCTSLTTTTTTQKATGAPGGGFGFMV